ncbi:MAG: PEP-CTERM sorting domain-containing protein [Phycisphaerae bacterium]
MKTFIAAVASVCLLALLTAPAQAEPTEDLFWAELGGGPDNWNVLMGGGGSGFATATEGPWFLYEDVAGTGLGQTDPWGNTNPVPGWWNQWYYDDPPDPERWKEVRINFQYGLTDPKMDGYSSIIINFTTLDRPATGPDGQPPLPGEDRYIGRVQVAEVCLTEGNQAIQTFEGLYDLRQYDIDFNPEWVSIDIVGYNMLFSAPDLPGSFFHECVPEPTTMAILALAGLAVLMRRKRT